MSRKEMTFERDFTFHLGRRDFGGNIPATDIDFLEYDSREPVLLWEAKLDKSRWKEGKRTHSMIAQWRLTQKAGIDYVVVEHSLDWSKIKIYQIESWEEGTWRPNIADVEEVNLQDFVEWLYQIRSRDIKNELSGVFTEINWRDRIPLELTPVILKAEIP